MTELLMNVSFFSMRLNMIIKPVNLGNSVRSKGNVIKHTPT